MALFFCLVRQAIHEVHFHIFGGPTVLASFILLSLFTEIFCSGPAHKSSPGPSSAERIFGNPAPEFLRCRPQKNDYVFCFDRANVL